MMTVTSKNGLAKTKQLWQESSEAGLELLIVNLMPTKLETELQFLKLLAKTKINCQVTFAYPDSHHFRHGDGPVVKQTYLPLSQALKQNFDGLIVTGAPVEHLAFEQVDYWHDFCQLVAWAQATNTYALFECWASQAALKVQYGIEKTAREAKLFGIYQAKIQAETNHFLKGFGSGGLLRMPQSRHTDLNLPPKLPKDLQLLASSNEVEAFLLATSDLKNLFITGHPEYATETLAGEYQRDVRLGKKISLPSNYYRQRQIVNSWQPTSVRLYTNWLQVIQKIG